MTLTDVSSRLSKYFSQALVSTLGLVTGKTFSLLPASASSPEARDLSVWMQEVNSAQGTPLESLSFATGADFSRNAGNLMLESAGVPDSSTEDIQSAWHEIAAQIMGQMVSSLNAEKGCELTLGPGEEVPHNPALAWIEIDIQGPESTYRVYFSGPAENEATGWAELFATSLATSAAASVANSSTFDLLLDVALPVSVSFGRTALQIREVLKLSSGSVIELNRLVSEPVDVVVNECVIARGEVVVVDGNYGVRITQIASREDRIRTGMTGADPVPTGAVA